MGKGGRNRGRNGEETGEEPGEEKSEGKGGRNGEGNSKRNEQWLATLLQNEFNSVVHNHYYNLLRAITIRSDNSMLP
jgi:hypothetical protein